ncbi:hypothetical protein P3T23_007176 [Paraburkholderia sp. GAS448]|jgi:hypothetical protein
MKPIDNRDERRDSEFIETVVKNRGKKIGQAQRRTRISGC